MTHLADSNCGRSLRTTAQRHPVVALALILCGNVQAQIDPLLIDAQSEQESAGLTWHGYGDFAGRAESTSGFTARDDIERVRGRLRLGLRGSADAWSLAVAAKLGAGSDANRDNRRNLDNESSQGVGLDELLLTYTASDNIELNFGKSALPLATTPLTWDSDLRPVGAWLSGSRPSGDFNRWSLILGRFAGDHLYADESRISVAQLGWHFQEGAPFSADVRLAWWDFDNLERAHREGLTRTNQVSDGRLLSNYRLLNVQLGATWLIEQKPLALRLDLVQNQGADDHNRGARFSAIYGDSRQPRSWEFAVAIQRIGQDAVSAAFNSDDWWFHSASRGVMPWLAYGFDQTWSAQLSGFYERRDGQTEHITRVLLDVRARW